MSYICSSYGKNGRSICTSHHIRERELCSIILNDLKELLNDNEIAEQILRKLLQDRGMEDWRTVYKRLQKRWRQSKSTKKLYTKIDLMKRYPTIFFKDESTVGKGYIIHQERDGNAESEKY